MFSDVPFTLSVPVTGRRFSAVRATDEIWYRRAVDYYRNDSRAFVYSVPFDAGLRNDSLVTVAQAVFVDKGLHQAPAAVVGMQFLHSTFREKFLSTASVSGDMTWRYFEDVVGCECRKVVELCE